MKNLKRAYRRHKKQTIFKRRAKIYWESESWYSKMTWADFWKKIKSGECHTWMRTLSTYTCRCSMCTQAYERPSKGVVTKLIQDELLD